MRTRLFLYAAALFGVGILTAAEAPKTVEPDPELVYAERVLKDASIAGDAPALLAFFRARTLTPAKQQQLTAAIAKLGDDRFDVREQGSNDLVAAGPLALPLLRTALKSRDLEVAGRARRCIEDIENVPETTLVPAAARLLAEKRTDEATAVLLGCLPWVEDEMSQEAVFQALARTALKNGSADPAVLAAAKDKEAVRRMAAAFVLSRGDAETRRLATPLLTDTNAHVRFQAAAGLIRAADKEAIPPLLGLLTDAPVSLAWQTEDLLYQLAGDKVPAVSLDRGTEANRRECHEAWKTWWKDNDDKIDLKKINWNEPPSQLTLVVELMGHIWECGRDGKPRWEINLSSMTPDARVLRGGRVLVAEYAPNRVTERDHQGNIVWEHSVRFPVTCQRLPNGNTFIASLTGELQEVTSNGKVVFSHQSADGKVIIHAEKLRDGRIVYITAKDMIYELDAAGKLVKSISTKAAGSTSNGGSVERVPNGNYLVAFYPTNKVAELDSNGMVVWQCDARKPSHATRLRNGNTLVTSHGLVVTEFDRSGKSVWTVEAPGPYHAWRR
jgi:hypothetical protein